MLPVVSQLGGTFGIDGEDVIYFYEDGVPGDHPLPNTVLQAFPPTPKYDSSMEEY